MRSRAVVPLSEQGDRPGRSAPITLIGWLFLIQAIFALGLDFLLFKLLTGTFEGAPALVLNRVTLGAALLLGISTVVSIVAAVGLFSLRPWGWTAAMAAECWNLLVALVSYMFGEPAYPTMVLGLLVVLTLNRREVRLVFERREASSG